jgi:hypothetical protein
VGPGLRAIPFRAIASSTIDPWESKELGRSKRSRSNALATWLAWLLKCNLLPSSPSERLLFLRRFSGVSDHGLGNNTLLHFITDYRDIGASQPTNLILIL